MLEFLSLSHYYNYIIYIFFCNHTQYSIYIFLKVFNFYIFNYFYLSQYYNSYMILLIDYYLYTLK